MEASSIAVKGRSVSALSSLSRVSESWTVRASKGEVWMISVTPGVGFLAEIIIKIIIIVLVMISILIILVIT